MVGLVFIIDVKTDPLSVYFPRESPMRLAFSAFASNVFEHYRVLGASSDDAAASQEPSSTGQFEMASDDYTPYRNLFALASIAPAMSYGVGYALGARGAGPQYVAAWSAMLFAGTMVAASPPGTVPAIAIVVSAFSVGLAVNGYSDRWERRERRDDVVPVPFDLTFVQTAAPSRNCRQWPQILASRSH